MGYRDFVDDSRSFPSMPLIGYIFATRSDRWSDKDIEWFADHLLAFGADPEKVGCLEIAATVSKGEARVVNVDKLKAEQGRLFQM